MSISEKELAEMMVRNPALKVHTETIYQGKRHKVCPHCHSDTAYDEHEEANLLPHSDDLCSMCNRRWVTDYSKWSKEMKVWTAENDGYCIGVYSSYDKAVEGIKERYAEPYIVEWETNGSDLVGKYRAVQGYSTEHTEVFNFIEWEIK